MPFTSKSIHNIFSLLLCCLINYNGSVLLLAIFKIKFGWLKVLIHIRVEGLAFAIWLENIKLAILENQRNKFIESTCFHTCI